MYVCVCVCTHVFIYLFTAVEFSPTGSSLYSSTEKTNKNQIYISATDSTKYNKYKYTYWEMRCYSILYDTACLFKNNISCKCYYLYCLCHSDVLPQPRIMGADPLVQL
jgi:hypothetical protein